MKDSRKNSGIQDKDVRGYIDEAEWLIEFIDRSPSCYHAIDNIRKELNGYEELKEAERWELERGKGYYVIRNSSAIIAFRIPKGFDITGECGFIMSAAHSDSPAFKIKQNGEINADRHYIKLDVEKYGGMIMSSWLDRPLSAAGRVFVRDNGQISERLVDIDKDLLIIPNVAIHMNRNINEDCKYNVRKDMQPLLGTSAAYEDTNKNTYTAADENANMYVCSTEDTDTETDVNINVDIYNGMTCPGKCAVKGYGTNGVLNGLIAETLDVAPDSILSTDLFLYPRVRGTILGAGNELIASRALDDLQCAYAIVQGFIRSGKLDTFYKTEYVGCGGGCDRARTAEDADSDARDGKNAENARNTENTGKTENTESVCRGGMIPVCCVFDNEEVGSGTRQGADSDFLHDVLYRITGAVTRMSSKRPYGIGSEDTVTDIDDWNTPDRDGECFGEDVNETFLRLLANSFMISADNAHAVHPNHPEYADENEKPYLNGGVVVKFNAAQKYTTDAYSYARLKEMAEKAGVPLQIYSNRPDIAGGSTLGNLSVRHVAVPCVDIGLPQLAMHSCYETAGVYDTGYLIDLMIEFYRT